MTSRRDIMPMRLLTPGQKARRQRKIARKRQRIAGVAAPPDDPTCAECGQTPEIVKGHRVYPHRPDLHLRSFWMCRCGAFVGCHPTTDIPLGRPAGPDTRRARADAHKVFDALWKQKMERDGCTQHVARTKGYAWLAKQLGYEPDKCHIAWMTGPEARRVIALCEAVRKVAA